MKLDSRSQIEGEMGCLQIHNECGSLYNIELRSLYYSTEYFAVAGIVCFERNVITPLFEDEIFYDEMLKAYKLLNTLMEIQHMILHKPNLFTKYLTS